MLKDFLLVGLGDFSSFSGRFLESIMLEHYDLAIHLQENLLVILWVWISSRGLGGGAVHYHFHGFSWGWF